MGLSFQYTVSALCYSIIHQRRQPSSSTLGVSPNQVVRFVLQQHSRMPDFLRFPIVVLTLAFDTWGIMQAGTLFHRQPNATRQRQIQAWRHSPISVCRDLIRFYESLAVFGWYASATHQPVAEEKA